MEVRFHTNITPIGRTPVSKPAPVDSRPPQDQVALENARAVRTALTNLPAARPDVVERAAQLAGDVHYPPHETIQQISHLLALRMQQESTIGS